MTTKAIVTVIPALVDLPVNVMSHEAILRRIAAYARVSTDSEEQESSFNAQVDYYTKYVSERPDWELVEVYTDEGVSAVNTKHRDGFKRMIQDALDGKIDLIITKSVSRFARNTVDSLKTIRQLKAAGVECYFEKENNWTFDDPYKKRVWQCNGKYRERRIDHCQTPHLSEKQLQDAFVYAFNQVVTDRERYIAAMEPAITLLTDCSNLDSEAEILQERSAGIYAQLEALVADNAQRAQDQAAYQQRYNELERRYNVVNQRKEAVAAERQGRVAKRESMRQFLETVRQREALLTGFDEALWRATVDTVTVHAVDDIRVRFRDGRELGVRV